MAATADFLVEIGTEELPPKALARLERAFADGIEQGVRSAGLRYERAVSFATPRRLAVLLQALQTEQSVQSIEKRGPPVSVAFDDAGRPTRAALAFAESCGTDVAGLDRLQTGKGEWLLFRTEQPGAKSAGLLPGIVADSLAALPIPKRMRWGDHAIEFVRPVHWVVMMLGRDVVPGDILGQAAGNRTRGHRFHAPSPLAIRRPADYAGLLRKKGHVIPGFPERRDTVRELAEAAARTLGGQAVIDASVLDEVTALVEWPVAVTGEFAADFLRLPEEVLVSTLQDHQRYFPVRSSNGSLAPNFIAISNLDSADPQQVRHGNERVVRPRLSDAAFFFDKDRRRSLADRVPALSGVVFERRLGSLGDKSARVAALGAALAGVAGAEPGVVARAAELAKTDLLTEMVGEFPELQGRMGFYYARHDGEPEAVAQAIEEQYLPRHAGDRLPASPAGRALAIADRLDTLAGIFAIGRPPSGNKDPFGLRRAALGLLRIAIEHGIDLDLPALVRRAIDGQPVAVANPGTLAQQLGAFLADRLKPYYLDGFAPGVEAGEITPEMFEAVRVREPVSPLDFHQRILAVRDFMSLDAADSLASANKRIANILRSTDESGSDDVDPSLFDDAAEERLYSAVADILERHEACLARRDYTTLLQNLSGLKAPVDDFFDGVMVMTDDESRRRNRLAQLNRLRGLFLEVADLSCIPPA